MLLGRSQGVQELLAADVERAVGVAVEGAPAAPIEGITVCRRIDVVIAGFVGAGTGVGSAAARL